MQYALHIFPDFPNASSIKRIRQRFDPLYGLIPPHLTVIFPFDAEQNELNAAMAGARQCIAQTKPFILTMQRIEQRGEYLMLLCENGAEEIIRLHDVLYAGPFAKEYVYEPHVTLGKGGAASAVRELELGRFPCTVRELILERICEDGRSEMMEKIPFKEV